MFPDVDLELLIILKSNKKSFEKGLRHLSAEKLLSVLGRICVFLFDRGHQEIWA